MSKKYEMSWLTSISDYTNENTGLMARAVYGAKTIAGGIEVIPGQKGDVKLNTLYHNLYLQAAACGWTVSGSTALDQVSVDVCSVDYKEALCPKTLEPKWYGQLMRQGSNPEDFPFSQYIIENKMKELSAQIEYMYWQGDTLAGTGNLALCTGLVKSLSGKSSSFVSTSTGLTAASIINQVNNLVASVDERIAFEDDLTLYISVAWYKVYTQQLRTANLFHYSGADGVNLECDVPGTNVKVVATPGLRGSNYMYLTSKKNLAFVTDLLSDTDNLDMWYSKDNVEVRILGSFKMGAAAYFPGFVYHNNPTL